MMQEIKIDHIDKNKKQLISKFHILMNFPHWLHQKLMLVILTTCGDASDKTFIKMMTFVFSNLMTYCAARSKNFIKITRFQCMIITQLNTTTGWS